MPLSVPKLSLVNLTPTSMALPSPESADLGVTFGPQMEHGHATLTDTPAAGVSRLPLSSTARDLIGVDGTPWATHEYDQLVVPVAGCQLEPPSVETSTPATTPPPLSVAV